MLEIIFYNVLLLFLLKACYGFCSSLLGFSQVHSKEYFFIKFLLIIYTYVFTQICF